MQFIQSLEPRTLFASANAAVDYLPLTRGSELVYERVEDNIYDVGDPVRTVRTDKVLRKSKRYAGGRLRIVRSTDTTHLGDDITRTRLSLQANGQVLTHSSREVDTGTSMKLREGLPLLPAAVRKGATIDRATDWQAHHWRGTVTGTMRVTGKVEGFEKVKVPAGTFRRCARLRVTTTTLFYVGSDLVREEVTRTTAWYARGIGEVKSVARSVTRTFGSTQRETHEVRRTKLTSFRIPAKAAADLEESRSNATKTR